MHKISVRGELLTIPKMCCCCCNPKAKQRYKVVSTRIGRWIDTRYRDKRWTHFLICKRCHQWVRAAQSSAHWFPQFLGSLVIGVLAAVAAVLAHLDTISGQVWGGIALVLLLYSALAVALWLLMGSKARRLDPGPPCHPYPVVLADWLRDKHTFEFSNEDYFNQFRMLNQDNLS